MLCAGSNFVFFDHRLLLLDSYENLFLLKGFPGHRVSFWSEDLRRVVNLVVILTSILGFCSQSSMTIPISMVAFL